MEIPGFPEFTKYGAYSDDMVYTREDVKRITSHGMFQLLTCLTMELK